jgi:LysR family glycine cleavage system transcriptional activator
MPSLRAKLPPLNSLVVFEAAARHLSFTRAAEELLISREAVSRQIRNLERHLGVKLFARLYRTLELTEAGLAFQSVVAESLRRIAHAAVNVGQRDASARITVAATVAIATFWLTPRLPGFRARHPEAEIRMVVTDRPLDMIGDGIDIALRYGDGNWPGMETTALFDVTSFTVCAPASLEQFGPVDGPADLLRHTLLNLDGATHAPEDWAWWLVEAGVHMPAPHRAMGFDNYANVIQAALGCQGIALGYSRIVDDLLSEGRLVRPLTMTLSKGQAVYLAVPVAGNLALTAREFRDWILSQA